MIVSIVTPCFNAEKYIKDTLKSVLDQEAFSRGRAELDYIIVDGKSTDGTLNVIYDIINKHPLRESVRIISESDYGVYDALTKGILLARGDIFAYLNADDYYSPYAVDIVLDIMENENVKWITGWAIGYNKKGQLAYLSKPFTYRKKFWDKGLYGKKLPFLQQEATFWRTELNKYIDMDIFKSFKLAGDYYLWHEFAKYTKITIVDAYIGGFRIHKNQLSKQKEAYFEEMESFIYSKINFFDKLLLIFDKLLWKLDFNFLRNIFGESNRYRYSFIQDKWEKVK